MDKKQAGRGINPPVFFGAAVLVVAFSIFGAVWPDRANTLFSAIQAWIIETFGWFYLLAVAVFVVFAFGLALSNHGRVRLGPDDSRPDYTDTAWFAMLFSAGMGIGLMFFGVAEPIMHFTSPPVGEGGTVQAAREAMKITFFHWGIHAWAIYAVIGLSLAYYAFRYDLPLTIRSTLFPLLGKRTDGIIGDAADIFAVLGTMFGVATSLGFGVLQINAGLSYLFGVPEAAMTQIVLIVVITLMATTSVVLGVDAGIKRLSEWNLWLALGLLLFVAAVGPTLFLFKAAVQNTGAYLSEVVNQTFTLYAYEPNDWIGGWTLFYWSWWIAWSPFVGMFIARVSRGRTIRQFIVGVLLVPVGFTFIWLTVFGNSAIALEMDATGLISGAVEANVPTALFTFLEQFPWSGVASVMATVLVVTFFVTSSDSGSLVIAIMASGGYDDAPLWQRVFWAVSEGVVAAVLLMAGGLKALQTAAITAALPFTFIMLFVCYALVRSLRIEAVRRLSFDMPATMQMRGAQVSWRRRLQNIVNYPRRSRIEAFLQNTVGPALEQLAEELRNVGMQTEAVQRPGEASLTVAHGEEREFVYAVRARGYPPPSFALPRTIRPSGAEEKNLYYRAEVHLLEGSQDYDIMGYTREQVIGDVLSQLEKHQQFLHRVR